MNHVRSFRTALPLVGALLAFSLASFAQSDLGSISGIVKDPTGGVVPKAKVTAKTTGVERSTLTNDAGYYTITNIPPATYAITVEAPGFKTYTSSSNKLDPSSNLAVDVTLTVGTVSETVEVTATAPPLQSESSTVQKLVTREQIDSLELNGRNPVLMAMLVPGARGGNLAGLSFSFNQGPSQINGARTQDTLITYDGAPAVRTRSNGTSLGAMDVDSTQEIQVLTADYSAEYGRSSGGQIRILTKTGTPTFHGSAYEYLRNTDLNANSWFRNTSPSTAFTAPFHYNQFGYDIGGPFYIPGHFNTDKSRFFWYWGQEWVKYHYTDQSTMTVPTLAMRAGNFSELLNPTNIFYGKSVTINDPTTGHPFPNNVIPANMLSANGIGLLKAYPEPNLAVPIGSSNWYAAALHPIDTRKDTLSVDINVSEKQRLQFRRFNYAYNEYQPLDGGSDRAPKFFNRPNQTNSVDYVWTVSPTVVNEALATVSLDDVYIPVDTAHFFHRDQAGINYPYIYPEGKMVPFRIPTVIMSNFSTLNGGPYPSHSSGPIYDASDSLTWVRGSHTFKFGALFERSGENDNDEINVQGVPGGTNNQNGQFTFTDTRSGFPNSGAAAANAALGLFDGYAEIGQRAYTIFRDSMWEGFAQDGWKATNKLHLDYGARYTVIVPFSALWRNMIVFDPSFYDPSKAVKIDPKTGFVIPGTGDPYNGMVIPGSGFPSYAHGRVPQADSGQYNYLFRGVPSYYSNIQWGQIQPRLGVAYQVTPNTVVRAGAGRFYTKLGVSDSIFLGGNPPFQPMATVSYGNVDNPGGTSANNLPLVVTTQSKAFRNPEAWDWNATVERQMPLKTVLTLAYVGRRGNHLQREANINQPVAGTLLNNPGVNINALRPYPGFGSVRETDNVANSMYNSFQVNWSRRFSKGLLFGLSYTLAKSMDDGSNQRDVIPDTYDAHMLWGPSEFDSRHVFVANWLYELPFFRTNRGVAGKVLGGWQISGIAQYQSGTPCGVMGKNDYAGTGLDTNLGCGNGQGQYWVVNGSPSLLKQFAANGASDPAQWFAVTNPDGSPIFTPPPAGTFNTQRVRDLIYGPGFQNWNLGLFKSFAINERTGFQFRAEAYNAFNHPNWNGPDYNPTSKTFGKITSKNSERNLQVSLRFYF